MMSGNEQQYPKMYLYRRLVQAKLFIDAHYSEAIDLENIADEAYFSKFHFIKQFKAIYQKTPHQYLISVRVEKAMQLLTDGLSVSDACYAVGFESVSTFSGLFKKVTGNTPSAFLAQQKQIREKMADVPLAFVPGCFAARNGWLEE